MNLKFTRERKKKKFIINLLSDEPVGSQTKLWVPKANRNGTKRNPFPRIVVTRNYGCQAACFHDIRDYVNTFDTN